MVQFVWDPTADPKREAAVAAKRRSRANGVAASSDYIPVESRPAFNRLPHLEQAEAAAAAHRAAKKEAAELQAAEEASANPASVVAVDETESIGRVSVSAEREPTKSIDGGSPRELAPSFDGSAVACVKPSAS